MVPLLTSPFLPPTETYALVKPRSESLQITEAVQTLFTYLKIGIKETEPYLNTFGVLDLEDQVTGNRKKMCRDLLLLPPPASYQAPNYIMKEAPAQVQALSPPKKYMSLA